MKLGNVDNSKVRVDINGVAVTLICACKIGISDLRLFQFEISNLFSLIFFCFSGGAKLRISKERNEKRTGEA